MGAVRGVGACVRLAASTSPSPGPAGGVWRCAAVRRPRRPIRRGGVTLPAEQSHHRHRVASGSYQGTVEGGDIWPITWAADGSLLTVWGDGLVDCPQKASYGVARITSDQPSVDMTAVHCGPGPQGLGKLMSIVAAGDTLYARFSPQDDSSGYPIWKSMTAASSGPRHRRRCRSISIRSCSSAGPIKVRWAAMSMPSSLAKPKSAWSERRRTKSSRAPATSISAAPPSRRRGH